MKMYVELARANQARLNCIESKNQEWESRHEERIEALVNSLPHGSGIDGKTEFDYEYSTGERLRIYSEYHCMNEGGYYDGWVNFTITLKSSLQFGYTMTIKGNFGKYADVKDYLYDTFSPAFDEDIPIEKPTS